MKYLVMKETTFFPFFDFTGTPEEAGLSMRVVRLFDFQFRHAMLFVEFVTRDGQVVEQAEFDPIGGDMIAFGANG